MKKSKMQRQIQTCGKRPDENARANCPSGEMPASFTIEAAYVTGIVIFCLAVLFRFGFLLHDAVVGTAVLNEGIERIGHSGDPDAASVSARGKSRMEHALSGREFQVQIEEYKDGFRGTAGGNRYQKELLDKGFHPEETLRKITLLEEILED